MIFHLMFADDYLLFCHGTEGEAANLKKVLDNYEVFSGQAINYSKSGAFFSPNVDEGMRHRISAIFGVTRGINTGMYLGLPSLIGPKKREIFSYIRDKVWLKLHCWRVRKYQRLARKPLLKQRRNHYLLIV